MRVRRVAMDEAGGLLPLYQSLVGQAVIGGVEAVRAVIAHPGTQIFAAFDGDEAVAMVTLHLLPNVTQGGRPYALIEHVVTAREQRKQGLGRAVMHKAIDAAWDADAYKIMLMTGKTAQARGFYEGLGFDADEKWGMSLRRVPVRTA